MEFGLFFLMQRDDAWSEEAVYDAEVAQMLAAEEHGFGSVWIAEHHFSDYGLCPAPPVLAAYVAARTRRLRVGMGISLLPLHDPLKLAEELAVLDQASGGRLDVGIGRGGGRHEYHTFGAEQEESRERVEEGIALMRACWTGEELDFAGRFRAVTGVRVTPRPRQRPHPPLYIAANSADTSLIAARLGLPTLSSFFIPAPELRRRREAFRTEALAAGHSEGAVQELLDRSWGMRVVHVAPDRATAVAATRAPFMGYQERLVGRRAVESRVGARDERGQSVTPARPFEEYLDTGMVILGSPDEVVDGLGRYLEETGYHRLMVLIALAGLPAADAFRAMDLFAARVMPQLASAEDIAAAR